MGENIRRYNTVIKETFRFCPRSLSCSKGSKSKKYPNPRDMFCHNIPEENANYFFLFFYYTFDS